MRYLGLYEQGVSVNRFWQYVDRWCCWLYGGLGGRVMRQGGERNTGNGRKYRQGLPRIIK